METEQEKEVPDLEVSSSPIDDSLIRRVESFEEKLSDLEEQFKDAKRGLENIKRDILLES